jgi:hypothetical protein
MTCFCNFWVPRSRHVTRTLPDAESFHEVSLLTHCATNDNSWPREKIAEECSSCCVGAVNLAERVCLELSLIFIDSGLSALVPLYLFETKQPPDEGYIRHALSYFPTITPWSWTTTISVPCLPLGYVDPPYVSQYCQWPRGAPISNLCPPHPICTVRVTFLYLLDILRPHSIYKAFVIVRPSRSSSD